MKESTHSSVSLLNDIDENIARLKMKSDGNASLSCKPMFAPKCSGNIEMNAYVRFWRRFFHKEDCYQSPLRVHNKANNKTKYLVFMPDGGGWNNIRMAAETAMIFGHATGRTIVLPPEKEFYLLNKNKKSLDNRSTFSKFFDLDKISESVDMVSMEYFLEHVAKAGLLKIPFPTITTTAAAGSGDTVKDMLERQGKLWTYLEKACFVRPWQPGKWFIGFNITTSTPTSTVSTVSSSYSNTKIPEVIFGKIPSMTDRFRKFVAHGRSVIPYDKAMDEETAIFFPGDYRDTHRILTHFYSYLYWADRKTEHIYKRLVRDRLHYHDDIFCAAGEIVRMIHAEAAALNGDKVQDLSRADSKTWGGDSNRDATYFAFHIRRGDFQYAHTQRAAADIVKTSEHLLAPHRERTALLYISTDEADKSYFQPFQTLNNRSMQVRFLENYLPKLPAAFLKGFNKNHIGMIEQVICANAHTFIGTPLSTFTGYITRMRGYYRDGRYKRTYYTMKDVMYQLQRQEEIEGPFWAREFAVAHKDIDDDPSL